MSATLVFRKDLEDVLRSRMLWGMVVLFVALVGLVGIAAEAEGGDSPAALYSLFVNIGAAIVLPIAAIFVGYLAVIGERESGSLRVLFGLDHGRRDVLTGKLASRLATMLVVTALVCVLAAGLSLALFGELGGWILGWFLLLTVLLAVTLTAVAVSVSAVASTRYRAMAGAVGGYLLAIVFWYPAVAGLHFVVEGSRPGYSAPEWYFFLQSLNPLEAYRQAIMTVSDHNAYLLIGWETLVEDIDIETASEQGALSVANRLSGDLPLYLGEWASVAVLLVWTVVPVALAYRSFSRADLN